VARRLVPDGRGGALIRAIAVFLVYLGAAKIGLRLSVAEGLVTPV
jgi:hypothetical protein